VKTDGVKQILSNRLFVKNFKFALEFHEQWLPFSIECFARRHFDPTLTDAVFLNIVAVFAIEPNANVVF
jgi:hypothetical protein